MRNKPKNTKNGQNYNLTYGSIQWHEHLAEPLDGEVDAVITQFEQQVDNAKIKGESDQTTYLRAMEPDFFLLPICGQEVMPKFLGVQVSGGEMRLELENPETGGTASFWIDIKTRKVLKTP